MAVVTWQDEKPSWTALLDGVPSCSLKGKDIGGWSATWLDERLWPAPAHLPKAIPQAMRFFPDLAEAKAAVEAVLNS